MKYIHILLLVAVAMFLSGCGSTRRPVFPSAGEEETIGAYILSELDPIQIKLLGIPSEKEITTVIDENGEITIPYLMDPIQASGLSISGLERKLRQIYMDQEIYKNVTVNIHTSSKTYYLEGEVRGPREYQLLRKITLLQAIAAGGGYTDFANEKHVTITRRGEVITVNAKKIEKNPETDITIEAGDIIRVERSWY